MKPMVWAILALALVACTRSGPPAPIVDRTQTYDGIFAAASKAATAVGERVADSVARVVAEVTEPAAPVAAPRRGEVTVAPLQPAAQTPARLTAAGGDIVQVADPAPVLQTPHGAAIARYRVVKGDTVYAIARRHDVDARAIIKLNNLREPFRLHVGDLLQLPGAAQRPLTTAAALDLLPKPPAAPLPNAAARPLPQPRPAPFADATTTAPQAGVILASAGPAPKRRPQPPQRLAERGPVGAPPPRAGGGFAWPVSGPVLAGYGVLEGGRFNDGLNIAAPRGTPVQAAENGIVVYAGNEIRGFGNLVLLKHDGGIITAYAHNDALLVRRGEVVAKGDVIARVGRSGGVSEPQLHFEIRRGKEAVDPSPLLAQQELAAAG